MSELLWGGLAVIAAIVFNVVGWKLNSTVMNMKVIVYFTLMFIAMIAWWISVEHLLR